MPQAIQIESGKAFGLLTALREVAPLASGSKPKRQFECRCVCGQTVTKTLSALREGRYKSCGCMRGQLIGAAHYRHGRQPRYLWRTWDAMKGRCFNPANPRYRRYGARGITVHPAWANDFAAFAAYIGANLGPRPHKHSLDRINNDGNYEPGNLRWATASMQARNQSRPKRCNVVAP